MNTCGPEDEEKLAHFEQFISNGCQEGDFKEGGCIGDCHHSCLGDNHDGPIDGAGCDCMASCDMNTCGPEDEEKLAHFEQFISNGCQEGKKGPPDCMGDCPVNCVGGEVPDGFDSISADQCLCIQSCSLDACGEQTVLDIKDFVNGGCVDKDDGDGDGFGSGSIDGSGAGSGSGDNYGDEEPPDCMGDCPSKCVGEEVSDFRRRLLVPTLVKSISADQCSCMQDCSLDDCDEETVAKIKDFINGGCIDKGDGYGAGDGSGDGDGSTYPNDNEGDSEVTVPTDNTDEIKEPFSCANRPPPKADDAAQPTFEFGGCDGGDGE
jgi:hypothetical protein